MVSPQVLLGVGVGLALAGIGGYVLWLWHRVETLEQAVDRDDPPGPDDAGEGYD